MARFNEEMNNRRMSETNKPKKKPTRAELEEKEFKREQKVNDRVRKLIYR